MSLAPGVRLGPYEIVSLVGAGGMGEVYKARDTRLDRTVAVRVLPALLASDADFRERFEREAKSISALNHPNICTLHDIGRLRAEGASASQGEIDFLVMEYLEGETLSSRLTRGAVPVAEALKIATEIASALQKAHRQNIVHRDLKPGNVMLTKTGAKLLDFGLAKVGAAGAFSSVSAMPTVSEPLTARGTILGTFQYMAPEQVEGEDADTRTDIFAYGALLFEMLTGRKAFHGKSQASLLGAILKDEPPPVSQVVPVSPPALDHVVRTCLEKDRDDRFQTAHDLVLQLRWIAEGGSGVRAAAPVPAARRRVWIERAAWATALVVATAAVVWLALRVREARPHETVAFAMEMPGVSAAAAFAISPDGRWVAFVQRSEADGSPGIWLRAIGSTQTTQLRGSENPNFIFWSHDSRTIAFRGNGRLTRLDIATGVSSTICEVPAALLGGAWNARGDIIFVVDRTIFRVLPSGGQPVEVLRPGQSELIGYSFPTFLPDGRHFLFFGSATDSNRTGIYAADLDARPATPVFLTKSDSMPVYAGGRVVFVREGVLLAQSFDAQARRTFGEPVAIAAGFPNLASGRAAFAGGGNVLAYRPADVREADLAWFDRDGKPLGVAGEPGNLSGVRLSPDGRFVAHGRVDPKTGLIDIWTLDLSTGIAARLTHEPGGAGDKFWSPDGRSVLFWSRRQGKTDLYSQALGAPAPEVLYESPEDSKWPDDWFGQTLLFHRGGQFFELPLQGERKPKLLLESPPQVDQAQISPKGELIAYGSSSSGRWEVYVAARSKPDERRQITANGGGQVHWRGDGKELFYLTPEGRVMSVLVKTEAPPGRLPEFAAPTPMFSSPIARPAMTSDEYDVTRDGKKFLFLRVRGNQTESPMIVTINWTAALSK